MTWVRIDDNFTDHPKFAGLDETAIGVWLKLLAYCNRHQTDGIIDKRYLPRLLQIRSRSLHVTRLIRARLLTETDRELVIHDYLDYQPSAAKIAEEKEKKKEAGRKGGLARAKQRASEESSPHPIPSHPNSSSIISEVRKPGSRRQPGDNYSAHDFVVEMTNRGWTPRARDERKIRDAAPFTPAEIDAALAATSRSSVVSPSAAYALAVIESDRDKRNRQAANQANDGRMDCWRKKTPEEIEAEKEKAEREGEELWEINQRKIREIEEEKRRKSAF